MATPNNLTTPPTDGGEEFLFHLAEAGDLLHAGQLEDAEPHLVEALRLSPKSDQARNMLGLLRFRLERFDEAESIFSELVTEYPDEPSLRLNRAMVLLKLSRWEQADADLQEVLKVAPEHKRALGFRGVVAEQLGQDLSALEFYEAAGDAARVERVRARTIPPPGAPASAPAPDALTYPGVPLGQLETLPPDVPAPRGALEADVSLPAVAVAPDGPTRVTKACPMQPAETQGLEAVRAQFAMPAAPDAPRTAGPGCALLPVEEVAYVKSSQLSGLYGDFELEPVFRRFRGRRTDTFFGSEDNPLVAAWGRGELLVSAPEALRFVRLEQESFFVLEDAVAAFSTGLIWENGRLPSADGDDLNVVHLQGTGLLAVELPGQLLVHEVGPGRPVACRSDQLLGWSGELVPRRAPLPGLPAHVQRPSMVFFEGQGHVFQQAKASDPAAG